MHRHYRLAAVLVGLSLVIAIQPNFTAKATKKQSDNSTVVTTVSASPSSHLSATGSSGGKVSAVSSTGSISGLVTYSSGEPYEGVLVTVVGLGISTLTDGSGSFFLPDVPSGAQFVEISGCSHAPTTPYPRITLKVIVYPDQDNPLPAPVRMGCSPPD